MSPISRVVRDELLKTYYRQLQMTKRKQSDALREGQMDDADKYGEILVNTEVFLAKLLLV